MVPLYNTAVYIIRYCCMIEARIGLLPAGDPYLCLRVSPPSHMISHSSDRRSSGSDGSSSLTMSFGHDFRSFSKLVSNSIAMLVAPVPSTPGASCTAEVDPADPADDAAPAAVLRFFDDGAIVC